MEHFRNVFRDNIKKLMDMSKNKNMTKVTTTWMNVCHTWVKHRGVLEVPEIEKVKPKKT